MPFIFTMVLSRLLGLCCMIGLMRLFEAESRACDASVSGSNGLVLTSGSGPYET